MKRATITIDTELETALDKCLSGQDARPSFTAVAQAALRKYLARRGALFMPQPTCRISITGARDAGFRPAYNK